MAQVYNIIGGGSGEMKPLIRVTAPSGSTVTCDGTQGQEVPQGSTSTYTFATPIKENQELPSEYQRVTYIQSTGTQYIDTGITATTDTIIDIDAEPTNGRLGFGCRISFRNALMLYLHSSQYGFADMYNQDIDIGYSASRCIYKLDSVDKKCYRNGTQVASFNSNTTIPYNIWLFDCNNAGRSYLETKGGKFYYAKVYYGNTLKRNFIPCYRKSDSVAGLYDTVSQTFFTNAGSGEFLVGAEVGLLPDWLQQCEYVRGGNGSYIDSALIPSASTGFDITYQYISVSGWFALFACRNYDFGNYYDLVTNSGYTSYDVRRANNSGNPSTLHSMNTIYHCSIINGVATNADGSTQACDMNSCGSNYSFYIFAYHQGSGTNPTDTNGIGDIFQLKFYDGVNVVRNYIPCYALESHTAYKGSTQTTCASGEAGLYDTVEGKFYINSGTGNFSVGGDVTYQKYVPYTIVATSQDQTKSKTVSVLVDEFAVFEVELEYVLWLYKDGEEYTERTGGWGTNHAYESYRFGTVTKGDSDITFSATSSTYWYIADIFTNSVIDMSGYSSLKMNVTNFSCTGTQYSSLRVYANASSIGGTALANVACGQTGEITCDISNISSGCIFVKFDVQNGSISAKVNKIWLE